MKNSGTNRQGSPYYAITINHPLYKNKKDVMKSIVKMNYKLKEKYGDVTFEFYDTTGAKVGAFKI